jgi:hypothetical protein
LRGREMELDRLSASSKDVEEDDDILLPGFRFHPTDEELVGFYLKKKVEKKPIRIDLIKHVDVYKYEPWDLPSMHALALLLLCSSIQIYYNVNICSYNYVQEIQKCYLNTFKVISRTIIFFFYHRDLHKIYYIKLGRIIREKKFFN